jgi:hypothetical protein
VRVHQEFSELPVAPDGMVFVDGSFLIVIRRANAIGAAVVP